MADTDFVRLCEECKVPAAAGWGNPPKWLCDEHFDATVAAKQGVMFDRPIRWICEDLDGNEVIV